MEQKTFHIIYEGKTIDTANCIEMARELGAYYVTLYNNPNVTITTEDKNG